MRRYISIFIFAVALIFFAFAGKIITQALLADIQFPVAELGNCQSESKCRTYCDDPANTDQCLDFAVKNGLMTTEEARVAEKFLKGEIEGPGGCKDKGECEAYCDNIKNIDECVDFAQKENLLPADKLQEFKGVQAAIKSGIQPPCESKSQCEDFCEDPANMSSCIEFGEKAGILKGKDLEDAKKMQKAIEDGLAPPSCRGRGQCEQYCRKPENMESCIEFASKAGFMSSEDEEKARKMLIAIQSGATPLACGGESECKAYCENPDHTNECIEFATKVGFMTQEEADVARKTGGRGPGGCTGKEQCEAFCQNESNREMCFNFAKEYGLISEEGAQRMEQGQKELSGMPPEAIECLKRQVGENFAEKMQQGLLSEEQLRASIKDCVGSIPEQHSGEQGLTPIPPQGSYQCQTPEECEKLKAMMQEQQMIQQPSSQDSTTNPSQEFNAEQLRQYEEAKRLQQEQQQQQPLPENTTSQPEEKQEPTSSFGRGQLLGAVVYAFFQLLLGR